MAAWPFPRRTSTDLAVLDGPYDPDAMTASVMTIPIENGRIVLGKSKDQEWQRVAYTLFHTLGEVRFAARYHGNALARVRFFVGTRDHPGDPIIPIPDDVKGPNKQDDLNARDVLERIKGRDGTFASLVRQFGVHRFVAGETYLVAEDGLEGETWEFLSTSELRRVARGGGPQPGEMGADAIASDTQTQYERNKGDGNFVKISDKSLVLRFWSKDPEFRGRADSPLRPVIDICESLRTAQAMQTAGDWSRLATMGLFLIPMGAELPKAPLTDNSGSPKQQPRLQLIDLMQKAIEAVMENPGSVAAISPIMVEVKDEKIELFKRITFEREIDKTIVARIDHLIRRFAIGIDLPPEVLTGVGDANHWSAWAVAEETISAHIAPAAAEFAEDLTIGYLRPSLELLKIADLDRYAIGFDVTDLVVSPDRAQHALSLYDKWELGGDHLLETLGFDPSVKPDMEEILHRIYITRATNPRNPDPGPDIAALTGKAPPPLGAEKSTPGAPGAALNPQVAEQPVGQGAQQGAQQQGAQAGQEVAGQVAQETNAKGGQGQQKAGAKNLPKGQQNADGSKTAKGPPPKKKTTRASAGLIGQMTATVDFAVDQAVEAFASEAQIEDPKNWNGLRTKLTELGLIDADTMDHLIDAVITLTRARKLNPAMDTQGAAQILIEAAMFDPDDLIPEDDETVTV